MPDSYRALCSDFYINQKIAVKLDLPRSRESGLELFERMRREFTTMSSFRRYKDELALESPQAESPHRWLALRTNSVRSGVVNPTTDQDAFGLHRRLLEVAPFYLSISPLDIDYVELLFGFDLDAAGSHDQIVAEARLDPASLRAGIERFVADRDARRAKLTAMLPGSEPVGA